MPRTFRSVPVWLWPAVGAVFVVMTVLALGRDSAGTAGRVAAVAACTFALVVVATLTRQRVVVDEEGVRLVWALHDEEVPVTDVSGFYLDPGGETIRMKTRDGKSHRTPLRVGLDVRSDPEGSRYDRLVADLNSLRDEWSPA